MPSLSPGTPGAKEAYGISVVKDDLSISIPPKAQKRYNIANGDMALITSTRFGEGGLAILNKEKAYQSVFKKIIDSIERPDTILLQNKRVFALTRVSDGKIYLTPELTDALLLKPGDNLLVVKSTTVAMSFSPVETWAEKMKAHGFLHAIENMKKLDVF